MIRRASLDNDGHQKGGRRPHQPDREVQGRSFRRPQSGSTGSETPNEEDMAQSWETDYWSARHFTRDSWTSYAG